VTRSGDTGLKKVSNDAYQAASGGLSLLQRTLHGRREGPCAHANQNSTAPPQVPLRSPLDFTSCSGAPKVNGPISVRVARPGDVAQIGANVTPEFPGRS
jgi:hypothetical protein